MCDKEHERRALGHVIQRQGQKSHVSSPPFSQLAATCVGFQVEDEKMDGDDNGDDDDDDDGVVAFLWKYAVGM